VIALGKNGLPKPPKTVHLPRTIGKTKTDDNKFFTWFPRKTAGKQPQSVEASDAAGAMDCGFPSADRL